MRRGRTRILGGLTLVAALCSLLPKAASAQREFEAGAAIDPWSLRGESDHALTSTTFVCKDTIDPWRGSRPSRSWIAVGSGLEPNVAWMGVHSGLEKAGTRPAPAPTSWVHSDIIDPWARPGSNRAAFPVP